MTIEALLGKSADELEAMSNEELETYFKTSLPYTRPELVQKEQTHKPSNIKRAGPYVSERNKKMDEARNILLALGKKVKF